MRLLATLKKLKNQCLINCKWFYLRKVSLWIHLGHRGLGFARVLPLIEMLADPPLGISIVEVGCELHPMSDSNANELINLSGR